MKKMPYSVTIIIILIVGGLSGCIDTERPAPFRSVVASITYHHYYNDYSLNFTEITKIDFNETQKELEKKGYIVNTHLHTSLGSKPYYTLAGGDMYIVAMCFNNSNFTHPTTELLIGFGGSEINGNTSTWATVEFLPTVNYYTANETNVRDDIAYIRLKAKEVFQICNITADVDKWELKVNYMD